MVRVQHYVMVQRRGPLQFPGGLGGWFPGNGPRDPMLWTRLRTFDSRVSRLVTSRFCKLLGILQRGNLLKGLWKAWVALADLQCEQGLRMERWLLAGCFPQLPASFHHISPGCDLRKWLRFDKSRGQTNERTRYWFRRCDCCRSIDRGVVILSFTCIIDNVAPP